ncbi:hypothetical protein TeGR_g2934 [Tetraparma gracilis]|uniref:EamA domain-containing protein n=1 Tax=Tetraparma gracilis TaxID=2962635 RepID=A0ABQ6MRW7_9STRA|nr:hypothetical protein TeGR_g2934 [Tetraparma gracilis]
MSDPAQSRSYRFLALIFLSGIGFSCQALLIKHLYAAYDFSSSSQVVFFRGLLQCLVSLLLVRRELAKPLTLPSLFGADRSTAAILFLRASLGYVGIAGVFYALRFIPMGDSTTLLMMSTVWSALLARLFLGEPLSAHALVAIPAAFAGLLLIVQPSFVFGGAAALDPRGVFAALLGSFGAAGAYVCVRMLGTTNKMYWAAVTFNQGLGQAVYSVPMLFAFGQSFVMSFEIVGFCLAIASVGCLSQACMTIGMQREKSALASVMRMSDILASFVFQITLTDEKANAITLGGAALIVVGVLIVLRGKQVEGRAADKGDELPLVEIKKLNEEEAPR